MTTVSRQLLRRQRGLRNGRKGGLMLLSLTRAYRRGERIIVNLGTVTYAEPCSVTYGAGDSVRLLGTRIYFVNGERVEVTNTFDVLEQMLDPEARLEELDQHVIDRKQVA